MALSVKHCSSFVFEVIKKGSAGSSLATHALDINQDRISKEALRVLSQPFCPENKSFASFQNSVILF